MQTFQPNNRSLIKPIITAFLTLLALTTAQNALGVTCTAAGLNVEKVASCLNKCKQDYPNRQGICPQYCDTREENYCLPSERQPAPATNTAAPIKGVYTEEANGDCNGGDLNAGISRGTPIGKVTIGACKDKCDKTMGCNGFSFTEKANGICALKYISNCEKEKRKTGDYQFWTRKIEGFSNKVKGDCDGDDLATNAVTRDITKRACSQKCKETQGCNGFSFGEINEKADSNAKGNGTCALKELKNVDGKYLCTNKIDSKYEFWSLNSISDKLEYKVAGAAEPIVHQSTIDKAVNDQVVTNEDSLVQFDVLKNDTLANPTKAIVTAVTQGSHGTVILGVNGRITYTPNADYNGVDSFTYTVNNTSTATVNVTITPVADIVADTLTTTEDTAITANLLTGTNRASADNFENAGRTITAVTQGTNGTVTIVNAALGTVTYTPNADFNGTDSFTYTVTSPAGVTETATVNVIITPVADILTDMITTTIGKAVIINVLKNDNFENSGRMIASVTNGVHGTVTIINPGLGTINYKPEANYTGDDSFTYSVTSNGVTETSTVTVQILSSSVTYTTTNAKPIPQNDVPVSSDKPTPTLSLKKPCTLASYPGAVGTLVKIDSIPAITSFGMRPTIPATPEKCYQYYEPDQNNSGYDTAISKCAAASKAGDLARNWSLASWGNPQMVKGVLYFITGAQNGVTTYDAGFGYLGSSYTRTKPSSARTMCERQLE